MFIAYKPDNPNKLYAWLSADKVDRSMKTATQASDIVKQANSIKVYCDTKQTLDFENFKSLLHIRLIGKTCGFVINVVRPTIVLTCEHIPPNITYYDKCVIKNRLIFKNNMILHHIQLRTDVLKIETG